MLARVPFATAAEVDRAVASAAEAFKTWRKTPIGARARIFLRYQQLIREHMKELAAILTSLALPDDLPTWPFAKQKAHLRSLRDTLNNEVRQLLSPEARDGLDLTEANLDLLGKHLRELNKASGGLELK